MTKLVKDIRYIQKLHFNERLSAEVITEELKARGLQPPDLTVAEVETALSRLDTFCH